MNEKHRTLFAEISAMLIKAKGLNENGQHDEALKQAYQASEYVAAAYLIETTGQNLLPNDTTFDIFAKMMREPNRHPALLQKIKEIVGDACALREAYEPALLDETTAQDARQMIDRIVALSKLVGEILK